MKHTWDQHDTNDREYDRQRDRLTFAGRIHLYADEQPACAPFADFEKTRRAIAKRDARERRTTLAMDCFIFAVLFVALLVAMR